MNDKVWHGVSIEIETDNAAFDEDERAEAVRIIREAADFIESGGDARNLHDINGNTVGRVLFADIVTPQR